MAKRKIGWCLRRWISRGISWCLGCQRRCRVRWARRLRRRYSSISSQSMTTTSPCVCWRTRSLRKPRRRGIGVGCLRLRWRRGRRWCIRLAWRWCFLRRRRLGWIGRGWRGWRRGRSTGWVTTWEDSEATWSRTNSSTVNNEERYRRAYENSKLMLKQKDLAVPAEISTAHESELPVIFAAMAWYGAGLFGLEPPGMTLREENRESAKIYMCEKMHAPLQNKSDRSH